MVSSIDKLSKPYNTLATKEFIQQQMACHSDGDFDLGNGSYRFALLRRVGDLVLLAHPKEVMERAATDYVYLEGMALRLINLKESTNAEPGIQVSFNFAGMDADYQRLLFGSATEFLDAAPERFNRKEPIETDALVDMLTPKTAAKLGLL